MVEKKVPVWVAECVVFWKEDPGMAIDRARLTDAWSDMFGTVLPARETAVDEFVNKNGDLFVLFANGFMYGRTATGDFVGATLDAALRIVKDEQDQIEWETERTRQRLEKSKRIAEGIAKAIDVKLTRRAEGDMAPTATDGDFDKCEAGGIMYLPRVAS